MITTCTNYHAETADVKTAGALQHLIESPNLFTIPRTVSPHFVSMARAFLMLLQLQYRIFPIRP